LAQGFLGLEAQMRRFYEEGASMTKLDALRILKLLSALESWAYSTNNPLPTFVSDDLLTANAVLEEMILREEK
jgi:hypothetical protein